MGVRGGAVGRGYAVDVKTAGSLSLAVSLPTMLVAFSRDGRHQALGVIRQHAPFAVAMTLGSVTGSVVGGLLVGVATTGLLVRGLAALLLASAGQALHH